MMWQELYWLPRGRLDDHRDRAGGLGLTGQITYHLNRAMNNGLTQKEAGEMLTQLAFHTGWPNVFSALPVFKDVFAKRPGPATAAPAAAK
jgi:alkylhydroperoxidase/carboxymuconolactone decarboxylase family protein YurZ